MIAIVQHNILKKYVFPSSKGHSLLEERAAVNILYFNISHQTFDSTELKTTCDAVSVIKIWESCNWQLSFWGKPTGYLTFLPLCVMAYPTSNPFSFISNSFSSSMKKNQATFEGH